MRKIKIPKNARTVNAFLNQARSADILVRTEDGIQFVIGVVDEAVLKIESERSGKSVDELLDERAQQMTRIPTEELRRKMEREPIQLVVQQVPQKKTRKPKPTGGKLP
jgi:hypothetical protein